MSTSDPPLYAIAKQGLKALREQPTPTRTIFSGSSETWIYVSAHDITYFFRKDNSYLGWRLGVPPLEDATNDFTKSRHRKTRLEGGLSKPLSP